MLPNRQAFVRQWGWLVALALLLTTLTGWAQPFPLQVQVSVLPPYSAYLQDYPGAGQQVRVFIINTSRQTYQIRLAGQLTGDNGIEIRTAANYRPPRPLTVPPGQTLLSRTDLEGLFDLNQVEVTGIDKNLLARGLPLPDGTYQLCIRAFNETATNTAAVAFGQPLSAEFPIGCSAPIVVRSVEPPILIAPLCDAAVTATNPQALVFTWTPPAGVSPVAVEYTLRVVELPQADVDPNVFIDAVALPRSGVEVRGLRTSTFLYGPTQPPLQLGRRYAWRVQAIDRSGKLHFLNDGKAPVCSFTYGTGLPPLAKTPGLELVQTPGKLIPAPGLAGDDTPPEGATAVASKIPAPPVANEQKAAKSGLICKSVNLPENIKLLTGSLDGKTVKLGEFDLTIATATGGKAGLSGTGRVSWNGAPIKVVFTDLQVNTDNQVINGTVTSDSKGPGMPKIVPGSLSSYASLPPDYFDKVTNTISNAAGQAIAVPLPIKYDGKIGTIGINQMNFSPVGAKMDLVLGVAIPEANGKLLLAATDVCTRPSQLIPDNGLVYLVKDFVVPGIGQTLTFRKKDPDNAKVDGTYANVAKGDFDKIHAVVGLNLGSKVLKLDNGTGGTKAGDVVSTITTDFAAWSDWIGTVELPAFQLPLLSGVTFTGSEVLYDHSSVRNVDGFSLPDDYKDDKGPTFEGVYVKKLIVQLPKSLKDNPRISVSVNGGVVDGSGFTGVITTTSTPVMDYKKENIAGFGFGIDHIQWTIVQNNNRGGSMLGQLQFPISTDAFSYSCNLSGGFDELQFTASPKDGYEVPLFAATMNLNKNTAITVGYKTGKTIEVAMSLGGTIAVNVTKFAGSGLVGKTLEATVPTVYFEQFALGNVGKPGTSSVGNSGLYVNTGFWDLKPIDPVKLGADSKPTGGGPWTPDTPLAAWLADSDSKPNGTVGGFPLSFETPKMVSTPEGTGIRLGAKIHLGEPDDDKSFVQVSGSVDILGTITRPDGRFVPAYSGTYPRSLSINGAVGPLTVSGGLTFINNDVAYGNGMKGNASVTLPGFGVGIRMAMLFGNVQGFKYSFIDGSVQFPAGVPIVGPIMLTGLGGGMHYNMSLGVGAASVTSLPKPTNSNSDQPAPVDLTKPGQTLSGQTYTPSKGGWGFTAKIYAGLADPKVLNTSLALTIDFAGGAMSGLNMHGNANVISKSGDGDGSDGIAHAVMDVTYAQNVLDASLDVQANLLTAKVTVPFKVHASGGNDWFVKLGDPGDEAQRINVTLLDWHQGPIDAYLGAQGYLATGVGSNLGGLPPVPATVANFLLNNSNTLPEAKSAYENRSLPDLAPIGSNYKLLLGGRIDADLKLEVEPFRLWAKAIAGFDVGLMKDGKCSDSNTVPEGVNGWYGTGQAYVYLGGGIDLFVDTWFYSGSVSLMELQAGALLQAGMPSPTWANGVVKVSGSVLDGLISVETTQGFSFGDKCDFRYNGDPLKDLEIISQMTPADGDTEVSTLPTAAVAFNMPMNKVFTIKVAADDIRYYKFIPDAPVFQVKAKGGTFQPITKLNPVDWSVDYRSYTLSTNAFLPSYATCQLTQRVVVKQLATSYDKIGQDPYNDKTGKQEARSQSKTVTFTLTRQPDDIPQSLITGAWPVEGQRYFLRKQTDKGFLRATTLDGLDCLKPVDGTQLVAIFNGPGGATLTQPVAFNGQNLLTFTIPDALKNKQSYVLEISRVSGKGNAAPENKALAKSAYVTMAQSPKLQLYRTTLNASAVQAVALVNQANQRKKLFGITFSTSQYNTFAEKLNAMNLRATDYSGDQTIDLKPTAGTYERFDKIDLFGGKVYDNFTLPRLLTYASPVMGTPYANTPYEKEIRTMIYDRMKQLATDNTGQYYSAGANQGQTDDFKPETLGQYSIDDTYDREAYGGVVGNVYGQPQQVVTYSGHGPMGYNALSSANKFSFLRDRLAFDDLTALSGIMKAMRRLNYYDVLAAKKYSPDKNLSDQVYVAKYVHDPNAESASIYDKRIYNAYQQQSFDNVNYQQIDGETYNAYGQIVSGSPTMQLYLQTFDGSFYRKMQYWKFAEDSYYQERQAYYDDRQVYHSGGPERGKSSPFTVAFTYGYPKDNLLPVKTTTTVFTIGSIGDAGQAASAPQGRSAGSRPARPGVFYLSANK